VAAEYLFQGPEPLIFGGLGGLGHSLIHLGYAFELGSKEVGMEALAMFTTNYHAFLPGYIDAEFPTAVGVGGGGPVDSSATTLPPPPTAHVTEDPLEIIHRIRLDPAFDGIFSHPGADNIEPLFELRKEEVLAYSRQFRITSPADAHKSLNRVAALLLVCSHHPGQPEFDFFVVHLTTVSYAIRTLLPEVPEDYALPLVKMHWLFIIIVYIIQLRKEVRPELVDKVELGGRGWGDVVQKALGKGEGSAGEMEDVHYLKGMLSFFPSFSLFTIIMIFSRNSWGLMMAGGIAVRAMKDSAQLWKDQDEFYLKAALKFAWEFEKWSFGSEGYN